MTLKCFICGKTKKIVVTNNPTFAFEVYGIANDSGMLGVMDWANHRTLVFCDDECRKNAITSKGTYRSRPKSVVVNG